MLVHNVIVHLGGNLGGIAKWVGGPVQNAPGSAGAPRLDRRARSGKTRDKHLPVLFCEGLLLQSHAFSLWTLEFRDVRR